MPFPDEMVPIELVPYRRQWAADFASLANQLRPLSLAHEGAIDHIGSTAIFALAAKDVIDVQIRLRTIEIEPIVSLFVRAGFRHRPEEWNNLEMTRTGPVPKLVFASGEGARPANVHVRVDGTAGARDALLFRDFLRSKEPARREWNTLKLALVEENARIDLMTYGQAKQPAWTELMDAADDWAARHRWAPGQLVPWSAL